MEPHHHASHVGFPTRRIWIILAVSIALVVLVTAFFLATKPGGGAVAGTTAGGPLPTSSASASVVPSSGNDGAPDTPKPSPEVAEGDTPAPMDSAKLATVDQPSSKPVEPGQSVPVSTGVSVSISALEPVPGIAQGIGEVSGPSLRFTVTIKNDGDKPISTGDVVVNVNIGSGNIPAISLSGPGVSAFPDDIAAKTSGSAVYVFLVPQNQRDMVRVFVNYDVDSTIAAFEGAAPTTEGKP